MSTNSVPESMKRFLPFTFILLTWLIILQTALCAGENASLELQSSADGNLSDSSPINEALNLSTYDVHVYVSNKDNERLKISLFIDSDLKETKELSSDSESKIDSYPLSKGPHLFKITWWDEDVKRSFEMQELKDIQNETSINLYASNHEAPDKYEILVKLTNENSNDLEAFLYVDDSFEKSKEVSKDGTSELGTIKLEEGVHNLSVRWQDRETKIEYEKSKKITVTRDDVLIFYAPEGVSFEAKKSDVQLEKTTNAKGKKETTSTAKETIKSTTIATINENASEKSSLTNDTIADDKAKDKTLTDDKTKDETKSSANGADSKSITKAETRTNVVMDKASYDKKDNPLNGESLQDIDRIYLYAVLVIVAVYLLLRH
ncbi:MAG: hypothetical protein A4E49_02160 [Methanosaeta sp. PtaU1.Bin112]|nr:MAG: hypothetical protein A4E49_02160 [Methanosaeta sp. PtaU1.Bin112]